MQYFWEQILSLRIDEQTQFCNNYPFKYPYSREVRQVAGAWIEDTFRASQHLNPSNPADVPDIEVIVGRLADELELNGKEYACFADQSEIQQCAEYIRANLGRFAAPLFSHIRSCLDNEVAYLQQRPQHPPALSYRSELINPEDFMWSIYRRMLMSRDELIRIREEWQRDRFRDSSLPRSSILEFEVTNSITNFDGLASEFALKFESYHSKLHINLQIARTKVQRWNDDKQKILQGKLQSASLELMDLQTHCEYIANRLWCLRELLKKAQSLFSSFPPFALPNANAHIQKVETFQLWIQQNLQQLALNSFIVKEQPSPLCRINKNTKPTLQLLIGEQSRAEDGIEVKSYLLTQTQAQDLQRLNSTTYPQIPKQGHFTAITSNSSILQKNPEEGNAFEASFKKSKLPEKIHKIGKNKNQGIEVVGNENFWFYFYAEWTSDGIPFKVSGYSHPVKVLTNASQTFENYETVVWDIAAGRFGVESVSTRPEAIPFQDLALALSAWFQRMTGRGLTQEHLDTIACKMLSPSLAAQLQRDPLTLITLEQFRKDVIPNKREFGFWKWIFFTMKMITDHLGPRKQGTAEQPGLWMDKAVLGFVTEARSEELLRQCPPGTFIIRFSFSTLSALTIDFMMDGMLRSTRTTSVELKSRSLLDRIMDIQSWTYLCPDPEHAVLSPDFITKVVMMRKYAPPPNPAVPVLRTPWPYVKTGLIARLEANG